MGVLSIDMGSKSPFLSIRLRAFCQATEVEDRVEKALKFVSSMDEIEVRKIEGHFGNPMLIFEAELSRSGDIRKFLERLNEAGILAKIKSEAGERLDDECVFHLRLDKQKAYNSELELAGNKDVIDVGMKVAAYPAKYELALENILSWFEDLDL